MLPVLLLAASATALATGIGVLPVAMLGDRAERWQPLLTGAAAGVMSVAAVAGLLLPGLEEGSTAAVLAGAAAGVLFLVVARGALESRQRHAERVWRPGERASILVFVILLVHSLPEGFAIGTAYASDTAGLSLFVIIAIGVQNVPEGTSIAIPMQAAGYPFARQFWAAVATSVPQPIGAVVAFLLVEQIEPLLPVSFGFAAGAMLAVVVSELLPGALAGPDWRGPVGIAGGAAVMLALSVALGV